VNRLARRLVGLYPRAWRERYEEEFVAMLEQRRVSPSDLVDVALGALDSWVRPQVASEGRTLVVSKMRTSLLAVLWAWIGFVVAGVGFQKMSEYEDFVGAARENQVMGLSFEAVVAGAVVALAAVVVGGAPIALSVVRQAFAEGRKDVPLLFRVPLFSAAAFVGYLLVLMRVVYPALGSLAVHDSVNVALFLSVVGAFVLAAAASAGAVSVAVSRCEIGVRFYRFALFPAALATLAMGVVLVATVFWGLALRAQAPALFSGDEGILATPTAATWLVIVVAMGLCGCAALAAVVCGLRARRSAGLTP
jgi:hypothetical protein